MAKSKRPTAAATADGAQGSFANGVPYHQKNQPDNDAIWDACREMRNADASRKARDAARVKAAALTLGRFKQNESGRWVYQCPDCQQTVSLGITVYGDVRASSSGQTTCSTVPRIQHWLRENGFQS